jgi:hypothetical protein
MGFVTLPVSARIPELALLDLVVQAVEVNECALAGLRILQDDLVDGAVDIGDEEFFIAPIKDMARL